MIKCQYCGCKYTPKNDRDCCPSCGAFNEFEWDDSTNKTNSVTITFNKNKDNNKSNNNENNQSELKFENNNNEKVKQPLPLWGKILIFAICAPFVFQLVIVILFGILSLVVPGFGDYSSNEPVEINYTDSLLDDTESYVGITGDNISIDYDKEYKVYGSFDELKELSSNINIRQLSYINIPIRVNDNKLEHLGSKIYFDKIEYSYYFSEYSSSGYVYIELESNGKGDKPKEVEMYLVDEETNTKDRIKADDYSLCYKDEINEYNDLFDNSFSGKIYCGISPTKLLKYSKLEVIVDDEIYDFDLTYDSDCLLFYYGTK